MGMTKYSPDLIEQTITVFQKRTGRVISEEDARQAVENISGFFRVLQNWAEAEDKKGCDEDSYHTDQSERGME